MNKPGTFITAATLLVISALSMAQAGGKTLLLTLKFQQDAFHVVNIRLLNEHLPKRTTYISSRDNLTFSEQSSDSKMAHTVGSEILSRVLEQANHKPEYTAYRVEGASILVRLPYQTKSNSSLSASTSPQVFTYDTTVQVAESRDTKREANSLPDQLFLSPSIGTVEEKQVYSDLL